MSTTHGTHAAPTTPHQPIGSRGLTTTAARALAVLRVAFGLTFLWAFFDKLFALGYHTGYDAQGHLDRFGDAAWIHGGSPTEGFLRYGAKGPLDGFYHAIAGDWWADWLFMLGLLGIGTALTLGIGMRVAGAAGALLYLMMWSVYLPPENNPVLDEHVLGAISLVVLTLTYAGDTWGAGRAWAHTTLVRRWPTLR